MATIFAHFVGEISNSLVYTIIISGSRRGIFFKIITPPCLMYENTRKLKLGQVWTLSRISIWHGGEGFTFVCAMNYSSLMVHGTTHI